MSKKPDTASALAGILRAKRGDETPPSPALPTIIPYTEIARQPPTSAPKHRGGKSSDKKNYAQFSVYLRKDTRKKAGRALDDAETGQDFSELVQELLEQWLASRT
jgi:hypothetical protein